MRTKFKEGQSLMVYRKFAKPKWKTGGVSNKYLGRIGTVQYIDDDLVNLRFKDLPHKYFDHTEVRTIDNKKLNKTKETIKW